MGAANLGKKAKFLDELDSIRQHHAELTVPYSIELHLERSPKLGIKCGAITVFKLNDDLESMGIDLDPGKHDPREVEAAKLSLSSMTDNMIHMVKFRESDGRWLEWAEKEMWRLFDKYDQNADFRLASSRLLVSAKASRARVLEKRNQGGLLAIFPRIPDMDNLLSNNFEFDPWRNVIRRGVVDAAMSKR